MRIFTAIDDAFGSTDCRVAQISRYAFPPTRNVPDSVIAGRCEAANPESG
jgi:hypothetical protein